MTGDARYRAIINTYFSLSGSVLASFVTSMFVDPKRKIDMVSSVVVSVYMYLLLHCAYVIVVLGQNTICIFFVILAVGVAFDAYKLSLQVVIVINPSRTVQNLQLSSTINYCMCKLYIVKPHY